MTPLLWRLIERRLRRAVPAARLMSTLGDLHEDYERQRQSTGPFRAACWLLRESRSLVREYTFSQPIDLHPFRSRGPFMFDVEFRHAWRRLNSRRGSSLLCAGLLAVGIGLTTAVFSIVDSILWRPAPFPNADRLVRDAGGVRPIALVQAWRESGLFDLVETWDTETLRFGAATDQVVWSTAEVSAGVFDALGARPIRGRLFTAADERAGGVIVLSERLWRSTFGADPELIGRRIRVDAAEFTVLGILPASFRFPEAATIAWTPLDVAEVKKTVDTLARIRPGLPRGDVEARMTEIARREIGATAAAIALRPIEGMSIGAFVRGALPLLFCGVIIVYLVLCANVSGLLLTGLSARQRELSVCVALGASRRRLLLETMIEHGMVGAAGIAGGLALAYVLMTAVPPVFVDRTLNPIDLDPRAFGAACALGMIAVLVGGLWPAWIGTRRDPVDAVRGSAATGTESRAAKATLRTLLVGQIALAAALLVGSAVLIRTFVNLVHADRGVDVQDVMRSQIVLVDAAIVASRGDRAKRDQMAATMTTAILERLTSVPSIAAVALSRRVPPESAAPVTASIRSDAPGAATVPIALQEYAVTPEFFEVYRIPVLRGGFTSTSGPRDVVVGERFASLLWPGQDPIGRTFSRDKEPEPFRVVGLAREITLPTIDAAMDRPEFYRPLRGPLVGIEWAPYISVRCRGGCPDPGVIRTLVHDVHPEIDFGRLFAGAEADYMNHLRIPRAMAELGSIFAMVAVLTAAGGLFSVITQTVARRRREFGIRSALGASARQMRAIVHREALTLASLGAAAGVVGGWFVARSLAAFHYGVTAADPVVWAAVLGTIGITALAAASRPAHQAARIDPVKLLRED